MAIDLDYDFYGTQLEARIQVTGEGSASSFDPSDPSPEPPDFIKFVYQTLEEISVEEQLGAFSTIEVTFSPTYEIALQMLQSPYIKVGNIMFVRWGYAKSSGQLSPWKSGLIISPPRVQLGPQTRITIVANGWGHELSRNTRNRGKLEGKGRDVFRRILGEYKFDLDKQLDAGQASDAFDR